MNQSLVEVRNALDGDLDAVARVWHESASKMDGGASPMPSIYDLRARINRELANGWKLYVAERQNRIIGMLAIRLDEAILDQIFVLSSERSSGVGTMLLATAKRVMPEGFTLRVAATNQSASHFYERAGLTLSGEGIHPISGVQVRYMRWIGR